MPAGIFIVDGNQVSEKEIKDLDKSDIDADFALYRFLYEGEMTLGSLTTFGEEFEGLGSGPTFDILLPSPTANFDAPSTPTGLAIVAFLTAFGLSWNVNPEDDIRGYEVQQANNSGFSVSVVNLGEVDALSFIREITSARGTLRHFRIRAVRSGGAVSAWSAGVSATLPGIGGADVVTASAIITATAQITAALIDTVHIKDAAIQAAKIGALQVQTAKIADLAVSTLKVGNLAISTGKVGADAISKRGFAQSTGAIGIVNTGWTDILTLVITATGSDVLIVGKCNFKFDVGAIAAETCQLRLLRDGTQKDLSNTTGFPGNAVVAENSAAIVFLDVPASGSRTYKLQGKTTVTGGTREASERTLQIAELKK